VKELLHNALKYYLQSFPINKGKARMLNLLWKPLSFGHYERQATLEQADIIMLCDITKLVQRNIYFYNGYEHEYCDYWMSLAKGSSIIFDVGANVGIYSLLGAAANSQASLHAFEPTPELFDSFLANIQRNGLRNIIPNLAAVGETDGQGFLHVCKGSDGSNEGMNFVTAANLQGTDSLTPLISIQTYCQRNKINRIDLMKIDIEGGEYDALMGAKDLLREKAVGYIFLELSEWAAHRSGHSTADIKRILWENGYQIYQLRNKILEPIDMKVAHKGDNNVIACAHEPR
jgi:FkbM family methyltransferase